jgi:GDP-L-fucose synthase
VAQLLDLPNLATAHVLPALIRRFHEAKQTGQAPTLWGTGKSRREFLHVDDCAEACLLLMERYSDESIVNVGAGKDIPIEELAKLVAEVVGYRGEIWWDKTKPDGTLRKLLDIAKIMALGWNPRIQLRQGIADTDAWYQKAVGMGATRCVLLRNHKHG